jgi:hypothetical protein
VQILSVFSLQQATQGESIGASRNDIAQYAKNFSGWPQKKSRASAAQRCQTGAG